MKQYSVIFSPRAEQQLGSLYAYIADRGGEEQAERALHQWHHCLLPESFHLPGTRNQTR
ncbi:type II toxin-antitoxin system RelE/ParE family toxin [Nostoc sp. CHAB 5714]|uniref:Type II toxin-antitoxin system RelE/ParE family toxin n=1 Tax=Nostoc favosum CHAB5714 TaxID=2780399 RepID=A0ABS8I826_9NOSO|nr:type II toxin-antitoxin system RelE/ParE family toxin [Nostoc favosum CHAB5714]